MSRFTCKCDIYDWFGMIACNEGETPYECFKRVNGRIFMRDGDRTEEVKISKPSDLVMFYPFISYMHFYSKEGTDDHFISKGSYLADTVRYNPQGAARCLSELMDEYWRVREEEDPKFEQGRNETLY